MSVDEEKNLGDEVEAGKTGQGLRSAAVDNFRRSVGFQFGFVLHSGLEIDRAIDHVCAAAERLVASLREWQPIETAPRDRSSFLIYCPESGDVFQAYRFDGDEKFRMFNSGGRVIYQDPTLWMPLPAPPSADESAQRPRSARPDDGQAS